jgi:hypothetical protein
MSRNDSVPTFHLLFLDAKKALYERNYSLSIVYGITALESVARQYVEKVCTQKGLSKKTFENIGLSTLVTAILRMIMDKDELPDRLVQNFKEANRKRNEIIHQAALDVERSEALKAFETIRQLIEVLTRS